MTLKDNKTQTERCPNVNFFGRDDKRPKISIPLIIRSINDVPNDRFAYVHSFIYLSSLL